MSTPGGKGSTQRPTDHEAFSSAWDRIFGKEKLTEQNFMGKANKLCQAITDAGWTPMTAGWVTANCEHKENCHEPFCQCEVKDERSSATE